MKRDLSLWINAALIERLDARARLDGRHRINLIEQALAEFLSVPLANRELPEQPVELCGNCQHAVLNYGRCPECKWRRDPRAHHPKTVRAREEEARKRRNQEAA